MFFILSNKGGNMVQINVGANCVRPQRGVTLVALVITIIILLILAGITIAALTGPNGLLNRAVEAREKTSESAAKEAINLALGDWRVENIISGAGLYDYLSGKQDEYGMTLTQNGDGTITIEKDGYSMIVDDQGNVIGDIAKAQIPNIKIDISYPTGTTVGGTATALVTVTNTNGTAKAGSMYYGWSNSSTTLPSSWTNFTTTPYTVTQNISGSTEIWFLWVKAEDTENNAYTKVSDQQFNDTDNTVPTIALVQAANSPAVPTLSVGGSIASIVDNVPIPVGFYYVGGTRDTGVVISDNSADENLGDTFEETGTLSGNQFVWVPASAYGSTSNIIATITCGISGEEARKWAAGNQVVAYFASNGTTFTGNTFTATTNGVYTVYVKGKNGKESVQTITVPATGMYDATNNAGQLYTFSTGQAFAPMTYSTTSYREPDAVTTYDNTLANLQAAGSSATTAAEFQTQLQNEINAMITSVDKYGGFYIGRYETGNLNQATVVVQKGNTAIGSQTWYVQYKKEKELYASSSSVVSSMIWGCEWDAALRWIDTNPANGNYVTDSTGKGNYSGTIAATGSNPAYKVNNIYDMAGNVYDWTIEAVSTSSRVVRGGYYGITGSSHPASNRVNFVPTSTVTNYGTFSQLYIQ